VFPTAFGGLIVTYSSGFTKNFVTPSSLPLASATNTTSLYPSGLSFGVPSSLFSGITLSSFVDKAFTTVSPAIVSVSSLSHLLNL